MASIIKADNIQKVSDGSNIIKKCGSTITLGSCGATISLACGATQTGFGRTGTVDWCTTAKTSPFTGVSGKGYFVNTTCGAVTVTLPATPTAGDIISIADYASTWNSNAVTLCRNGSLINAGSVNPTLTTTGQSITLVYVDGTRGWKNTMDSTSNVSGQPNFIVATGGTITCCGDYKIHTFTSDGTFTICSAPTPANNFVSYTVVAGGGGTSNDKGGGGGAGGYREGKVSGDPYTASPLVAPAGLPVSTQSYPITVGAGGSANTIPANPSACSSGSNSVFSTITSAGGGGGGVPNCVSYAGAPGGSGGGARSNTSVSGGTGNTPPVAPPQGNPGGNTATPAPQEVGGGGGGATTAGSNGQPGTPSGNGGGGTGTTTSISGSPTAYAGGGGAGSGAGPFGPASPCGTGGIGAVGGTCTNANGTTNRGGGGGGGGTVGRAGGSGVVIIRYKYQ